MIKRVNEVCIFCSGDCSSSVSVEHIVPESLGNKDHYLPRGIVCDKCNNYFARKIEGPLLSGEYFRYARAQMLVRNKRGLVPPHVATIPKIGANAQIRSDGDSIEFDLGKAEATSAFIRSLANGELGEFRMFIPIPEVIEKRLMSRFLGKVAIEGLAARLMASNDWRSIVGCESLDLLRNHTRFGTQPSDWEFSRRRVYSPHQIFSDESQYYNILHQFDFFLTNRGEMFFVMEIFGEEFAIDMTNPNAAACREFIRERGCGSLLGT